MVAPDRAKAILETWKAGVGTGTWEQYVHFVLSQGYTYDEILEAHRAIDTSGLNLGEFQMTDWVEVVKYFTGLYLLGDPGSGKSCSMLQFLGLCTRILGAAQIVAVDWQSEPGKYPVGITVIESPEETIRFFEWMFSDLEERRSLLRQGQKKPLLIWTIDEVGDIGDYLTELARDLKQQCEVAKVSGDKEYAAELLRRSQSMSELLGRFLKAFGTKGRKYNYLGICGNQVSNVEANGLKGFGDALESYVKVFTGRLVEKWGKIQGVDPKARAWLSKQAYPCLADGKPAYHLTHWGYESRERNQPPLNMLPIHALPVERVWNRRNTQELQPNNPIALIASTPNPNEVYVGRERRDRHSDLLTLKSLPNTASDAQKLQALGWPTGGDSRIKRIQYVRELEQNLEAV